MSSQFPKNSSENADQGILFEEYWTKQQINKAILNKTAFKGTFIKYEKQKSIAFIKCEDSSEELQISSFLNQNRALHLQTVGFVKLSLNNKEINDYKIVHIFTNPYKGKTIVGYLQLEFKSNKYTFVPKSNKLPRMEVTLFTKEFSQQVERDKVENIQQYYVAAEVVDHKINKYLCEVQVKEIIGKLGQVEIETNLLLQEQEIVTADFSPQTELQISQIQLQLNNNQYQIPIEIKQQRMDFTKEIIFSIDPEDARDLDDALSVKQLEEDLYEIGVHIADVEHFVTENSALDEDAKKRCSSIYLVQKVVPMLPQLLCENVCSLNPNEEKLTFSVLFQMNGKGEVLWEKPIRFGKSVINSCNKLSYGIVQQIFEDQIKSADHLPRFYIPRENINKHEMFQKIRLLLKLGLNRRKIRSENKFLQFNVKQMKFTLNEQNIPTKYSPYAQKEANFIVEEFMLLANIIVAQKISSSCQRFSLLRRHQKESDVEKIKMFTDTIFKFGHMFDCSSLDSILESMLIIQEDTSISEFQKEYISTQMHQIVKQAEYFVVGDNPKEKWRHFALNEDIYTHFTSPIRRYPDIVVHRTLRKILEYQDQVEQHINLIDIISVIKKCNEMKMKQNIITHSCLKIFMCLYLKQYPKRMRGIVQQVNYSFLMVFVIDLRESFKVIFTELTDLKKKEVRYMTCRNQVSVQFQTQQMENVNEILLQELQEIQVYVQSTNEAPIDYKVNLLFPNNANENEYYLIK